MNGRRRKGSSDHILLIRNNQYPILRHVRPSSHRDVLFIDIISLHPTQIVDGGRALKATLSFNWALALIDLIGGEGEEAGYARSERPSSPQEELRSSLPWVVHSVFFFIRPGLIFRNPQFSTDYFRFHGRHVGIQSFQGKINLFWNLAGLRREGPMKHDILCMSSEHLVTRHKKSRCQQWHSAVNCCCYRAPPQAETPCCRHCYHCLIRGSSGGADVVACGGSSSGGRGRSSGAILFLLIVVIFLLLAYPPCRHHSSPFFCSLLFLQAAACPPSTAMVGGYLRCPLPSLSLLAIQRLLTIVSPATGCGRILLLLCRQRPAPLLTLWPSMALSSRLWQRHHHYQCHPSTNGDRRRRRRPTRLSSLSSRAAAWACWRAQSCGRGCQSLLLICDNGHRCCRCLSSNKDNNGNSSSGRVTEEADVVVAVAQALLVRC